MKRKTQLLLGSTFFMMSGLLITLERLIACIYWFAQTQLGSYPTNPETVSFFSNLFVPIEA